ncbi:hypothetical protein BN000_01806 [Mycobacterium europaeum]|uniref:Uncharacterized protein n=1 Tax=Mycobacterium europaeum TaxID=761804 RepID=A0A0U1D8C6_9MYCO|nr:hypothetical protein BN000_01806 [Mycobacterium europaeum]
MPSVPARWAAAVAGRSGANGSPVNPCRGPRSLASLTRREASARLISVASAIAWDSVPPSSSGVAWRARELITGCSMDGSWRRTFSQRSSSTSCCWTLIASTGNARARAKTESRSSNTATASSSPPELMSPKLATPTDKKRSEIAIDAHSRKRFRESPVRMIAIDAHSAVASEIWPLSGPPRGGVTTRTLACVIRGPRPLFTAAARQEHKRNGQRRNGGRDTRCGYGPRRQLHRHRRQPATRVRTARRTRGLLHLTYLQPEIQGQPPGLRLPPNTGVCPPFGPDVSVNYSVSSSSPSRSVNRKFSE